MISSTDSTGSLAIDSRGLDGLRQAAKDNSPEALKAVSKQFEAMFMNMMLKSMRSATPQDGMFDSEQSKMYTSLLDQQLSQNLASRGIGLADVLTRQLSNKVGNINNLPGQTDALNDSIMDQIGNLNKAGDAAGVRNSILGDNAKNGAGIAAAKSTAMPLTATPPASTVGHVSAANGLNAGKTASTHPQSAHVKEFQQRLSSHAEEASRATGIPAQFMLGQAALESGWGRKEIKSADGSPSHNLFGIKAGANWTGKTVATSTTEYVNGVAQKKIQKFRAYDSYTDAFKDYGKLLSNNPRYQDVIANAKDITSFAKGLQRAGYATDPNYAEKLVRVIRQTVVT